MIREKKTKSGPLLEADFFPVWPNGKRMPERAPKAQRSSEAQAKYNQQQAVKRTIRIINTNFGTGDVWMHPTYEAVNAPSTREDAMRDIRNYIRRVKTKRASELKRVEQMLKKCPEDKRLNEQFAKLSQPFKYYGRIEKQVYKSGPYAGLINWHFHIFMTGGIDRDTLEDMWPKGMRTNADRFQPEKFGPEAAARYASKDPDGDRRFFCSKNLDKPKTSQKDGKTTRRSVERMCALCADDKEFWEKRYKGYRFIRAFPRFNEFNGHWYLSVIMYKTDGSGILPEWKINDWAEEWEEKDIS